MVRLLLQGLFAATRRPCNINTCCVIDVYDNECETKKVAEEEKLY